MTLPELLHRQAEGCAELGSPLYAELLHRAAEEVAAGGPLGDLLRGHEDDRARSAVGLRLMGAVHRVVLQRRAPALAVHYPSVGGTPGSGAWEAFRGTALDHAEEVRALLLRPPQTNEPGRAAVLAGLLVEVGARTGLPVRLLEIGASGGLNLQVDRFGYDVGAGRVLGDPASALRLVRPWSGPPERWPRGGIPPVLQRAGCDADPVDVATTEGRLALTSYVWADQRERVERLRAALAVAAAADPAPVERATAGGWLERELRPRPGVATVVWHSVLWQYLSDDERVRVTAAIGAAGARATPDAPVAHVSLEPGGRLYADKYAFAVRLQMWPGDGDDRVVARAAGHGPPVVWGGPAAQ